MHLTRLNFEIHYEIILQQSYSFIESNSVSQIVFIKEHN